MMGTTVIRKILLSLASIFLVWQSYGLLRHIDQAEISHWGLSLFIAWVINMFITGIFAFSGFAFPTQRLLPDTYYAIHHPQRLKKIYRTLGVDRFRKLLLATLWRGKKQRKKYFDGTKAGITHLEEQSTKSEFGHLIPFVVLSLVSIYLIFVDQIQLSIFTLLFNILGNLYPVLLQRHHRMRIQVLKKRFERKV